MSTVRQNLEKRKLKKRSFRRLREISSIKLYPDQIVPLILTVMVFCFGVAILWLEIVLLNKYLTNREIIFPHIRLTDVFIGLTIYLKTSIDFAIFIGRLMNEYPGWKNRIKIEIGTALGNIVGTLGILLLWDTFREIEILMVIMIFIAGLVLLRMAEDGLKHSQDIFFAKELHKILMKINGVFDPLLDKVIPHSQMRDKAKGGLGGLFMLSFSVPFILGLDDFAGYVPLFNVVNIFGFATGVFLGHMLLNIALFISPQTTTKLVKNYLISFIGSIVFIALAIWGFIEAAKLVI